ncbi:hypothetical protein BD309DRAFT_947572 [Dichomitus squalens]|uniref:Uncharacterized protein n=2 Tax=Dichomitus squalens TaxID=114155 RepID=A0A4V2K5R6_9APHY|nr:uncharacterized protein DICSQDRAFT_106103 [Dichomitus squalens LYAD-421 SS1]EJF61134.1 hypothetical protein DICSQDRAFT_106103 [Dichomitus squalens LYAD-421 SS1]TBU49383.1 hypothetical protein BD309DRAFT_947572 [Dichomitus squalens]TBU64019.1 hypothetical protein BD310DRAFT_915194 [Dichomitus squalens]
MHILTPNHVQLISACYPPSSALLTAGPDYSPNSQELSRLTYYAANRPGKISKLGNELERRAKTDSRKAAAGNTRARASLLITLAIFKAIAAECRRDLALLSPSLLSSVNTTLSALPTDLEIAARAATVFTAWTTYTDGLIIGGDQRVTEDYMSCLKHFARLCDVDLTDHETRNRTRLVGLAAFIGTVSSEALYHSQTYFQTQVQILMRAILPLLFQVDVVVLEQQLADIKEQPNSPILDEFRSRPMLERRAASIHVHIDGDQGPTSSDVANTALRATSTLLGHTNGIQASAVVKAALDTLDEKRRWDQVDHCRWLAEKWAEWTQYQYRYGIPTRLVECLAEGQDTPQPSAKHSTLAAMITTVFTSPTPLVNLSTSDIIASLISITLRRITLSPEDALLPALVECISSLGTHVYYADQIQDLAGELISRLVIVEANGLPGAVKANLEQARTQAVRCLLAGLLGLIHAADLHDAGIDPEDEKKAVGTAAALPAVAEPSRTSQEGHIRPSRRTKVTPETWQDTLSLLCDRDYAVRADYAKALVEYVETEIPKLGDKTDSDGVRRPRPVVEGPVRQASTINALLYGDSTTRFLNALHAYVYALATVAKLGLLSSSSSPERTTPAPTADGEEQAMSNGAKRGAPAMDRPSISFPPRSRRTSLVSRLLREAPAKLSVSAHVAAEFSDFGNILAVLTAVHEHLPVRSLLIGVPMLVALERATRVGNEEALDASTAPVLRSIKELVAKTWLVIGRVWSCSAVTGLAEKALSALPSAAPLPSLPDWQFGTLQPPQQPIPFPVDLEIRESLPDIDTDALVSAIAGSDYVQEATGLGLSDLLRRLDSAEWSADGAFRESMETKRRFDSFSGDNLSPLVKVAPTLMHAENLSMQSLARSGRAVGVTDLREALEGRSSMSNPNLVAGRVPSISTLDHTSSVFPEGFGKLTPTRSRPQQRVKPRPGEVKDVLNKLGIGKQNAGKANGGTVLKSSFQAIQKTQSRTNRTPPAFPPYTT